MKLTEYVIRQSVHRRAMDMKTWSGALIKTDASGYDQIYKWSGGQGMQS